MNLFEAAKILGKDRVTKKERLEVHTYLMRFNAMHTMLSASEDFYKKQNANAGICECGSRRAEFRMFNGRSLNAPYCDKCWWDFLEEEAM